MNYLLAEAAARAGLPPVHPHMLLHSCGFSLANRGYDLHASPPDASRGFGVESGRFHAEGDQTFTVLERWAFLSILEYVAGKRTKASPIERLSDREWEVFQLIGRGKSTVQIADELHLSTKTVEAHRARVKEKLDLQTMTELISFASRWVDTQDTR